MPSISEHRLRVVGLSKTYRTRNSGLLFPKKESGPRPWGLKAISFEALAGERIGVVGRNGSGKSTLLKLISRVLHPTAGQVASCGKIASMLEVGCGFHPDLSGLDNVIFTGAVLGQSEKVVRGALEEILDFAQLDRSILSQPAHTYSNGMRLRLAFATSTYFEPDILIVDETLTVGDYNFQKRCLERLLDLSERGCTILAASHSPSVLRDLCQRGLLLENGELVLDAPIGEIIDQYINGSSIPLGSHTLSDTSEEYPVALLEVSTKNGEGEVVHQFGSDQSIELTVTLGCTQECISPVTRIFLTDEDGRVLLASETRDSCQESPCLEKGRHELICCLPPNLLSNRRYLISVSLELPQETFSYNRVLAIDVNFKGYHSEGTVNEEAAFRPRLNWEFRRLS